MSNTVTLTTTKKTKILRLSSPGTTTEQTKYIVPTCGKIKTSSQGSPSKEIANLKSSISIDSMEDNDFKNLAKAKSNNNGGTRVVTKNHMQKKSCQESQPNIIADLESSNSKLRTENLQRESNKKSKSFPKGIAELKSLIENLESESNVTTEKGSKSLSRGIAELKSLIENLESESNVKSEKGSKSLSRGIAELKSLIEHLESESNMTTEKGSKSLSKSMAESVVSQNQQCLKPTEEFRINLNEHYCIVNNPVMQYETPIFNLPMYPTYNDSRGNISIENIAWIIYEYLPILRLCPFVLEFIDAFNDYDLRRRIFSSNERIISGERKLSWNEFLRMSSSILRTKDEIFLQSFRERLVSLSSPNVYYRYYIMISRESGCNSSSKMFTPDVFEEALILLRDYGIGPLRLTYTTLFPSDCRMFVHVPVYVGGYINRLDQKDKPQLNRSLKQNEVNMETFTQNISKETKSAPKRYGKCERNPSERKSSTSNSSI